LTALIQNANLRYADRTRTTEIPMKKEPALRLPYAQQFTPEQTPINLLLNVLRQKAGKPDLRESIASAFFKSKTDPKKLAGNTLIALRSFEILDTKNQLTDFGKELLACQGKEDEACKCLAKAILLKFNGVALIETLREMDKAGLKIELISLPQELEQRGFQVSKNSSDLSGILGWLRKAKVLNEYKINPPEYQALVGVSATTMDVTKNLTKEQLAFLRAMLALNVLDWTPYNDILRHAEALYQGELRVSWKDGIADIVRPLEKAGLLQMRKKEKKDKDTPEGRGGKAADVKPTKLFEDEFAIPLLESLYRAAGFTQLRLIRSTPLSEIVANLTQTDDQNLRGRALEFLAVRFCQMLDLDFMGWQETDIEMAGGGEVDAMLHSTRLVYSRWQIQCKVGSISLEAVAKEVGMQEVTLSNVIMLVSSGKSTASAETYRRKIIYKSNLNIIFIQGDDLQKIVKDSSVLLDILRKQAQDALNLKPQVGGLITGSLPIAGTDPVPDTEKKRQTIEGNGEKIELPPPAYRTKAGQMFCGDSLKLLPALIAAGHRAKLIITSPPFALLRKKDYGNEDAENYVRWFLQFIPYFKQILDPQGSLIIDIGGSWIKGIPAKSTYHLKLLLKLCESGFYLAQDFYHYNPAKLPTPAEWVTIRRLRVKDAINSVWWLTLTPFVKADNRRVLAPYSESMKSLIKNGYKPAVRPSGHDISDTFQRDNGGAIPPNLLEFSNTESNSYYLRRCKDAGIKPHPARFPIALPDFFIKFLTDPNDVILDPFAGSNVTGEAAEKLGRQWLGLELNKDYVAGSQFRFETHIETLASVGRPSKEKTSEKKEKDSDTQKELPL
jgi:DNA modification methylase